MKITVRYFAALRDQRGIGQETVEAASHPAAVYTALRAQYSFSLTESQVRFAVNGRYVEGDHPLKEGDDLVFIPPVAGG